MFAGLGAAAGLGDYQNIVCDANGLNCQGVNVPSNEPLPTMPQGAQPPGTVLSCAYPSDPTVPGTCYWTPVNSGATPAARIAAATSTLGVPNDTLIRYGVYFGMAALVVLLATKGK